ncbi:hypothetical protein [Magnetospirillum sp. LM-5]|uniref:hypothetical protein n=1 Tax=Magnetospirillum sp. LM-5 TaxID=2681466 RepID=UPI00156D5DAF|nr:hypothetical protein [Magnetospirillum sp. LM-5]
MLSLVDCIAFSGLTPEQVDSVACFKHIPTIVAAEWAEEVLDRPDGPAEIEAVLEAEAKLACDHHLAIAADCAHGLCEFRLAHPELGH